MFGIFTASAIETKAAKTSNGLFILMVSLSLVFRVFLSTAEFLFDSREPRFSRTHSRASGIHQIQSEPTIVVDPFSLSQPDSRFSGNETTPFFSLPVGYAAKWKIHLCDGSFPAEVNVYHYRKNLG